MQDLDAGLRPSTGMTGASSTGSEHGYNGGGSTIHAYRDVGLNVIALLEEIFIDALDLQSVLDATSDVMSNHKLRQMLSVY